jgi:hypothetical protein
MRTALTLALAALATLGLFCPSGCDPTLETTSLACSTSADCPLQSTCDPRTRQCVAEPEGTFLGQLTCRVFERVSPPDSPSTTDIIAVLDGERVRLQGSATCFQTSIIVDSAPSPDGTVTRLTIRLPDQFAGGKVDLGPSNAWIVKVGGGRAEAEIAYGVGGGQLLVSAGYGVGHDASASMLVTPTHSCGVVSGAFCPSGQRCAALFTLNVKSGICTAQPEQAACSSNIDCAVGSNCVQGGCRTLCGGRDSSDCSSSEACAEVNSETFETNFKGVCAPSGSVAKVGQPCPSGTFCEFASLCSDLGDGPMCRETCKSAIVCGMGSGCTRLSTGQGVCAENVAGPGGSCAGAPCSLDSICFSDDKICHEFCEPGGASCPAERPTCHQLTNGDLACAAP